MGVTIHYRGTLDDIQRLDRLCDELEDLAGSMKWRTARLDDDWAQPPTAELHHTETGAEITGNLGLKGIQLTPGSDADSLSFLFDREGHLRMPMHVVSILDGTLDPTDAWVFVKTQFGPPEDHAWMVGLLRYLKRHYMADLQVQDEGDYWDTGDLERLRDKMNLIDRELNILTEKLSSVDLGDITDLSPEQIASRIEELLDDEDDDEAEETA